MRAQHGKAHDGSIGSLHDLAELVKAGQSASSEFRDRWTQHCEACAGGKKDPHKHPRDFLLLFLDRCAPLFQDQPFWRSSGLLLGADRPPLTSRSRSKRRQRTRSPSRRGRPLGAASGGGRRPSTVLPFEDWPIEAMQDLVDEGCRRCRDWSRLWSAWCDAERAPFDPRDHPREGLRRFLERSFWDFEQDAWFRDFQAGPLHSDRPPMMDLGPPPIEPTARHMKQGRPQRPFSDWPPIALLDLVETGLENDSAFRHAWDRFASHVVGPGRPLPPPYSLPPVALLDFLGVEFRPFRHAPWVERFLSGSHPPSPPRPPGLPERSRLRLSEAPAVADSGASVIPRPRGGGRRSRQQL